MSTLQQRLDALIAERTELRIAQSRILTRGQSQQFGDRRHQAGDLEAIQARLAAVDREIGQLEMMRNGGGSLRARTVVFS